MNFDINNILSTTTQTIDKIKGYKNGGDAILMYFDYIKHGRIQETNQPYATDKFMMKSMNFGKERFSKAKKILTDLGLIELVRKRNNLGQLNKTYIKINFIIHNPENQRVGKPEGGKQETNAGSNINKMLKENKENAKRECLADTERKKVPLKKEKSDDINAVVNYRNSVKLKIPNWKAIRTPTKGRRTVIEKALKEYGLENIQESIKTYAKSKDRSTQKNYIKDLTSFFKAEKNGLDSNMP